MSLRKVAKWPYTRGWLGLRGIVIWELQHRVLGPELFPHATHTSNPVALSVDGRHLLLFNARIEGRSHVLLSDGVGTSSPRLVELVGCDHFSDWMSNGCSLGNAVYDGTTLSLYVMGWSNVVNGRWRGSVGELRLEMSASRPVVVSQTELLTPEELGTDSLSYPFVFTWQNSMWLIVGVMDSWPTMERGMQHTFRLVEITSGGRCVNPRRLWAPAGDEYAVSRPSLLEVGGKLFLWYARKKDTGLGSSDSYEIECRTGSTLEDLELVQKLGLSGKVSTWQSEVSYPSAYRFDDQIGLYYAGSGYGSGGIGHASLAIETALRLSG